MAMVKNRDLINSDLKYPEDFIDKIICGDCLELIKLIPNNSMDVVLTDPPYGLKKMLSEAMLIGQNNGVRTMGSSLEKSVFVLIR